MDTKSGYSRCGSFEPASLKRRTKKELEEYNVQEWTVKLKLLDSEDKLGD